MKITKSKTPLALLGAWIAVGLGSPGAVGAADSGAPAPAGNAAVITGTVLNRGTNKFLHLANVQINNEGLDARQITLRGMPPSLTLVTMDGNQVASAASTAATRTFEIDQLSVANIERIEVFKAPIPSMPANVTGGTVNLVTKNAFSQKGRRASFTLTAAFNSQALNSNLYFDLKGTYQNGYLLSNTGVNAQLGTQRDPYLRWDSSLRYRFSRQSRYQLVLTGRNLFERVHTQSELGRTTRWFDDAGAWYSAALAISL